MSKVDPHQSAAILAHYSASNEGRLEMLRSVIEAGKSALNALLLINGGAAVAILGMVSNLVGKPQGDNLARTLAVPLAAFGFGVLSAGVGFALRYFSQACYAEDYDRDDVGIWGRFGQAFAVAAVLSGLGGFVLFATGVLKSYAAVLAAFGPA